jgi:hypothetical protein
MKTGEIWAIVGIFFFFFCGCIFVYIITYSLCTITRKCKKRPATDIELGCVEPSIEPPLDFNAFYVQHIQVNK